MRELVTNDRESSAQYIAEYGENERHRYDHTHSIGHVFACLSRSRPDDVFEFLFCVGEKFEHKRGLADRYGKGEGNCMMRVFHSSRTLAIIWKSCSPSKHFKIPSRGCQ